MLCPLPLDNPTATGYYCIWSATSTWLGAFFFHAPSPPTVMLSSTACILFLTIRPSTNNEKSLSVHPSIIMYSFQKQKQKKHCSICAVGSLERKKKKIYSFSEGWCSWTRSTSFICGDNFLLWGIEIHATNFLSIVIEPSHSESCQNIIYYIGIFMGLE